MHAYATQIEPMTINIMLVNLLNQLSAYRIAHFLRKKYVSKSITAIKAMTK